MHPIVSTLPWTAADTLFPDIEEQIQLQDVLSVDPMTPTRFINAQITASSFLGNLGGHLSPFSDPSQHCESPLKRKSSPYEDALNDSFNSQTSILTTSTVPHSATPTFSSSFLNPTSSPESVLISNDYRRLLEFNKSSPTFTPDIPNATKSLINEIGSTSSILAAFPCALFNSNQHEHFQLSGIPQILRSGSDEAVESDGPSEFNQNYAPRRPSLTLRLILPHSTTKRTCSRNLPRKKRDYQLAFTRNIEHSLAPTLCMELSQMLDIDVSEASAILTGSCNGPIESKPPRWFRDLYTPRFLRQSGIKREALCTMCRPPTWHRTKISTYWYFRHRLPNLINFYVPHSQVSHELLSRHFTKHRQFLSVANKMRRQCGSHAMALHQMRRRVDFSKRKQS